MDLISTVNHGDLEEVKELIDLGCNVNERDDNEEGTTPLIW